jgi:hypothetical protein
MADLILNNVDPVLSERILRLGLARGWGSRETLVRLLERGLENIESGALAGPGVGIRGGFSNSEAVALSEAISALKAVP